MLRAGVLGAGHLGKIHLRLLNESNDYDLVGFYDPDKNHATQVAKEFGYKSFDSVEQLIQEVDVVDIVTPTLNHFECASLAIDSGKHIFIEKPITNTVSEAEKLRDLIKNNGVKGQVGHVERFNPAFLAV
ncbi:Gfo/Idh/MocA family protein, partial [Lutimonas sp.]|uniref:Gfo/Idh/MocA family protein n=1 Tax=Lutimonas sp. TaxID=1872403 RepID=UPI003D9AC7EE